MSDRPFVYVASPYTRGDQAINTHFQCRIFDILMTQGIVWPYVPLWSHFQHSVLPRKYTDWTDYDNAIIPRMDACVRLDAHEPSLGYLQHESSGADAEVELFKSLGKPVFYSLADLTAWAAAWHEARRATA